MAKRARKDGPLLQLVNDNMNMQDAFLIIDKEVSKHENEIVTLWKRRNTFAPVSRLPPEMLCRIFYFASQDLERGPLHWIKVSHVCHEWRDVAVNSPSLWTNLPLSNARWTEEMLSRSRMADLTVTGDFLTPYYRKFPTETISSALRQASRIRHLSLKVTYPDVIQGLLSELPQCAPNLESLCIHQASTTEYCEILENVLCQADRLHRLEITGCKINWDCHLWSSLTSLKIHNTPPTSKPTTTQLWNAFKRMPNLESMDLQRTLPMPEDSPQPREKLFFAHLQKLTVISSTPEVQMLLEGISFRPTVVIKLECNTAITSDLDFTRVLSSISSLLSSSAKFEGMNIRTLEVSMPSGLGTANGLLVRASTILASHHQMSYIIPNVELLLSKQMVWTTTMRDKTLMDVCGALPLKNLVGLHLESNAIFTPHTLAEAVGTLPQLRSMYTVGRNIRMFIQALQETQNLTTSTNPGLYFRALHSIFLRDVIFGEDITMQAVQDCLIWRYECGVEVLKLKLEECYQIAEDDVSLLGDIIVDLEWDGLELGLTEEEEEEDYDVEYDEYSSDSDHYNPYLFF
ncbi:hypothetical protein GALMADRAFT_260847 [Galerina marginata CBS 339.88]|uniref:F-box domain-containing protein n=1 Tax=Galerina marginata (strain CBS 339.88) TaxID=685588 RepID=A0A067TS46_GALM3|nr:hypothetical protein GALMADRAFT_260847 [Galerina marginata CBS 339.88]